MLGDGSAGIGSFSCLDWKAGFPARGGLGPPEADFAAALRCQHTAGLGTQLFFPTFFVYSVRQRRTCARARTVPVVQPAILLRWSGLTEPCRLQPVAILKLTGLAVEAKSCLFWRLD